MGIAKNGVSMLRQVQRGKRTQKLRLGGGNETLGKMRDIRVSKQTRKRRF
jgi:hypothetical protein